MLNLSLAQSNCPFRGGKFDTGVEANLFGDKVNVREKPAKDALVIANLTIGTPVSIIENTETEYAMNGFGSDWYKVSFDYNNDQKTGYIWGGLISMASAEIPFGNGPPDMLVYSITSWDVNKSFNSTLRIVRNGKMINSLDFKPISTGFFEPGVFGHSVCVSVMGNRGFTGVKNIISVSYTYAACGYENGEILLFWNGSQLIYAAKASMVSEAGVFHYDYEISYPDDKEGKKDLLMITQTLTQYNEVKGDYVESQKEVTLHSFRWDGSSITELPEETK